MLYFCWYQIRASSDLAMKQSNHFLLHLQHELTICLYKHYAGGGKGGKDFSLSLKRSLKEKILDLLYCLCPYYADLQNLSGILHTGLRLLQRSSVRLTVSSGFLAGVTAKAPLLAFLQIIVFLS